MKQLNLTCLFLALLSMTISCKKTKISDDTVQNGNWILRASFPGIAMGEAATFTVNNMAYVGTGMNPLPPNQKLTTMFNVRRCQHHQPCLKVMIAPMAPGRKFSPSPVRPAATQ